MSDDDLMPTSYASWRRCITVKCAIPLTADYAARRLRELGAESGEETRRFRALYGDAHWRAVLGWFERARQESERAGGVAADG
jgi:hypothetical protein